ncbi:MAG: IPT/TIG domain-containing protein [Candidatus Geothermincolia bacterium]
MKKLHAVVISLVILMVIVLAAGCGPSKPVVKSVAPKKGFPGTGIEVTGTGFGAKQEKSTLRLGSKTMTATSWSDTSIAARVPQGTNAETFSITVKTAGGVSNKVLFDVESAFSASTPLPAMTNYLKSIEVDTAGMTYSVITTSKTDPNWKLDKATGPEGTHYFLFHRDNAGWSIVDYGTKLTAAQLKADGAPDDIQPTEPGGSSSSTPSTSPTK